MKNLSIIRNGTSLHLYKENPSFAQVLEMKKRVLHRILDGDIDRAFLYNASKDTRHQFPYWTVDRSTVEQSFAQLALDVQTRLRQLTALKLEA
jgi:hypothetical protein